MKNYLYSNIIDIKHLLALTLNKSQTWIWTNTNYILTKDDIKTLKKLIKKRENGIPFAYLAGKQSFYHLDFIVNKATLIPRPETESMIDIVKNLSLVNAKVLELGTGSGAIAITLKDLRPNFTITALDNNIKTLAVAKKNSQINNTNIKFILSDWFENIEISIKNKFDIIISNPPYINKNDPYLQNLSDPINALISADKGLKDIKIIIKNSPKYLKKNGYLLLEHGYDQQQKILKLLTNFKKIQTFKDINGLNRNILAKLC